MEPKDCSSAPCEFVFGKPEREISAGFGGKLLKLESLVAKRFYALYCEQFNPDLTVADSVVEEWISRWNV